MRQIRRERQRQTAAPETQGAPPEPQLPSGEEREGRESFSKISKVDPVLNRKSLHSVSANQAGRGFNTTFLSDGKVDFSF